MDDFGFSDDVKSDEVPISETSLLVSSVLDCCASFPIGEGVSGGCENIL